MMFNTQSISDICLRYRIKELSLFGSAATGEMRPDSDVDILVEFLPGAKISLFDMVNLREELKTVFEREVDLVSKNAVLRHHNELRRKSILENTKSLYAA